MVEGQNSDIILEFKNVTKEFPGVKALDDVSLRFKEGQFMFFAERMKQENQR